MPAMEKVRLAEKASKSKPKKGVLQLDETPKNFLPSYKKNITQECKMWYEFRPLAEKFFETVKFLKTVVNPETFDPVCKEAMEAVLAEEGIFQMAMLEICICIDN